MIEANEVPTNRIVAFTGTQPYKVQGADNTPRVIFSTKKLTSGAEELPPGDFVPLTIDGVLAIFLFYKGNIKDQIHTNDPAMNGVVIHKPMTHDTEKRITF